MLSRNFVKKSKNFYALSTTKWDQGSNETNEEIRQRLLLMSSPYIVQRNNTGDCGPVAIAQMINWTMPIKFPFIKLMDVSQFLKKKQWLGIGEQAGENELPGFTLAFSKIQVNTTPLKWLDLTETGTDLFRILYEKGICQVLCVVDSHFIVVHYNRSYGEHHIYVSGLWDRKESNLYIKPQRMTILSLYEYVQREKKSLRVLAVFVPQS